MAGEVLALAVKVSMKEYDVDMQPFDLYRNAGYSIPFDRIDDKIVAQILLELMFKDY
ncbi:MAG: hypothetical protein R2827_12370 [Bdellovibrionales bacterium]